MVHKAVCIVQQAKDEEGERDEERTAAIKG